MPPPSVNIMKPSISLSFQQQSLFFFLTFKKSVSVSIFQIQGKLLTISCMGKVPQSEKLYSSHCMGDCFSSFFNFQPFAFTISCDKHAKYDTNNSALSKKKLLASKNELSYCCCRYVIFKQCTCFNTFTIKP